MKALVFTGQKRSSFSAGFHSCQDVLQNAVSVFLTNLEKEKLKLM